MNMISCRTCSQPIPQGSQISARLALLCGLQVLLLSQNQGTEARVQRCLHLRVSLVRTIQVKTPNSGIQHLSKFLPSGFQFGISNYPQDIHTYPHLPHLPRHLGLHQEDLLGCLRHHGTEGSLASFGLGHDGLGAEAICSQPFIVLPQLETVDRPQPVRTKSYLS